MTGIVGNQWAFERFAPMEAIPNSVRLTTYSGGAGDFVRTPLQEFIRDVEAVNARVRVGRVFRLDEITEAHRLMEENRAEGKLVVLTAQAAGSPACGTHGSPLSRS